MTSFTNSIDSLVDELGVRKDRIKRYLFKHFQEGRDYIIRKQNEGARIKSHGGHNKEQILIPESVYLLVKNNYNLKHRFIKSIMNTPVVHPLLMSIENATLGFLVKCLDGIVEAKRQYRIGSYFVDCYLPSCNLVIECDEFGHSQYNSADEKRRQEYISSQLQCTFIRYNPNSTDFDLGSLVNDVLKHAATAPKVTTPMSPPTMSQVHSPSKRYV
ncbi:MAG: DUF559 domain-containing protein [Betaproteobacteria bacterium]|nr:DUF559 domain-containing protein [Betaproteobacteria bacterium]